MTASLREGHAEVLRLHPIGWLELFLFRADIKMNHMADWDLMAPSLIMTLFIICTFCKYSVLLGGIRIPVVIFLLVGSE